MPAQSAGAPRGGRTGAARWKHQTYMESTESVWAKACSSFGGLGNRFSLFGISTPIQLRIWRIIIMRISTSPEPTLNRELSHALSEYLNECTFWRLSHGQVVPLFCHLDMLGCVNRCLWRRCYTYHYAESNRVGWWVASTFDRHRYTSCVRNSGSVEKGAEMWCAIYCAW